MQNVKKSGENFFVLGVGWGGLDSRW